MSIFDRVEGWRGRKGPNPENKSGMHITGHRIILAPKGGETITAGGIFIPEKNAEKNEAATVWATVLEIGTECFSDKYTDYCDVGDRVLIGKYCGKTEKSPKDGKRYRIINDLDIIAVMEDGI